MKLKIHGLALNTLLTFLTVVVSCGSPTNDSETCQFDVYASGVTPQSNEKLLQLQGNLPPVCETLTRENSGKLVISVRVVGQQDESVSLAQVQAGNRTKSFDKLTSSLKVGSVDATFSSQSEPGWTVPWADAAKVFTVAIAAPLSSSDNALPTKATVRLSL